jgi:hypothetical protein
MLWNTNFFKKIKIQSLSHRKHLTSLLQTKQLILSKRIITVSSKNHNKSKYTMWKNAEGFNVKPGGAYSYHWALNG